MPYIDPHRRNTLAPEIYDSAMTPGELNYQITYLLIEYMGNHGVSYSTINNIMGACEGAKQEFYRRVAVPYEDTKIEENGDVYT